MNNGLPLRSSGLQKGSIDIKELKKAGLSLKEMEKVLSRADSGGYRTASRLVMLLVLFETAVIFAASLLLFYSVVIQGQPENRFYTLSNMGEVRPLIGLPAPSQDDRAVIAWVSNAASDIMTFGFNDINMRFANARQYFSPLGWTSFVDALRMSGVTGQVMNNRVMITSILSDVPEVTFNGIREGKQTWDVTVPLVMTGVSGGKTSSASATIYVTIVRVPTRQHPSGLGIEGWFMV
ncbi:MAG: DotI/IcmL family type IV secretion protein [Alphaproteobacteria bacterium]|nr:DotI/IcmL family type IV secretion protein [Alphaproteobacteria bacterium]